MKAYNKKLKDWLHDVGNGVIRLPRFQRKEVWKPSLIKKFFHAVIMDHPIGVLLLLEVNSNDKPFVTRKIIGSNTSERCRMHLLDGQQRLTALFRALHGNYTDKMYFVKFARKDDGTCVYREVVYKRLTKAINSQSPVTHYDRGLLPVTMLNPSDDGGERFRNWKNNITNSKKWKRSTKEKVKFNSFLNEMREKFKKTNIPYLIIPQNTEAGDAIDIFRNINTSAVRLSHYDIANAQCEQEVSKSLHGIVKKIEDEVPALVLFEGKQNIGDLMLKLACMDQEKEPKMGNYHKLDYKKLHNRKEVIISGLQWCLNFLESEGIWDKRWMPSKIPFRVLPLLDDIVKECDRTNENKATKLIRSYCWRTYLTDRYTSHANDKLYEDFLELHSRLTRKSLRIFSKKDTIFDNQKFKIPSIAEIKSESWPTMQSNICKAMLAIIVMKGARGIETGTRLSKGSGKSRDFHHIFPTKLIRDNDASSLAINCMLLEPAANRSWNNKWPGDYLTGIQVPRRELITRLSTHTLPASYLIGVHKGKGKKRLKEQYEEFCNLRAELICTAMKKLYKGEEYR